MGLTNEEVQVDGIDQMIGMIKKLGGALDPKHEASMREIIAALRYEPIHHGRTAMTDRIGGILYPMGYLAQGGQFALAQMGEISRIVGTLGFQNTLKQMPILQEMLRNWKNPGSDFRNFSAAIDQWWAPSTDRLRRTMNRIFEDYQTDEYGGFISRGMEAAARKIGATADLMSDISLLAPMQSFTQNLTAAATIQHMWEASRGLTKYLDDATVRTLGFEPEEYARLVKWVGDNAVTEARFLGDRVVDFKSVDSVEMMHLGRLVDRMVRTRIQDIPTRGDFAKGMFSFMGRMLTQFRTFNLKGVDNFLLQNASRVVNGGPGAKTRVFSEVAATMVFAGAIQWSRNAADWYSYKASNDFENMEEIEKKMTLAGFARGALTGPSEFFLPMMLTDTVSTKLIDRDPLFSPYRYSGLSLYGVPAAAYAMRAGSVVKDVYGATVGKALGLDIERDITQGTIHKARLLLPFQTMIGLKQYFNILEQQIVDEYDLPKTQPRNRDVF
jgi:hypothetical protein